jgi:hypothetical protein
LVSAWASEQGLALGQREVDGKSNEITAIQQAAWNDEFMMSLLAG